MTETKTRTAKPPRHFLRRLAALLIDGLVYGILATFVVGVLATAVPSLKPAVPSSFISSRTCSDENTNLPVFDEIAADWPDGGDSETALHRRFCTTDSFFLPQKRTAMVSEQKTDEDGETYSRSVSVQLDESNNPIFVSPLITKTISTLEILLFPAALALSTILLGWTPGKKLMSLAVTRDPLAKSPPPLRPMAALSREYIKFWPVWVNALLQLVIAGEAPIINSVGDATAVLEVLSTSQRGTADLLVLNAATIFVLFVWWVWPFALWRGRALYDGFVGSYVVVRS